MNAVMPTRKTLTATVAFLLAACSATGTIFAIDQQRAWLVGHLVTDMEALGTFDGTTLAKVPGIVSALTDDQVALLAQYYYLTRSKTEQDASLYAMQQQGYDDERVNTAKAEIADLLTAMNDQIVACYDQFTPMPQPVQYLAQVCYATVPGWCCHARCFVPDWYYDNGCFVGPCFNAAYAGDWGVPVCRAYYDHDSHFYGRYHSVANTVYINRSVNVAHRRADWFRRQGDWRSVVAHDRLLHHPVAGYQNRPQHIGAGQNHVGARNSAAQHAYRPQAALGRQQHLRNANNKSVARHQKLGHAPVARQHKAQGNVGKARHAVGRRHCTETARRARLRAAQRAGEEDAPALPEGASVGGDRRRIRGGGRQAATGVGDRAAGVPSTLL